ncbi:MAG: hypothetical protein EBY90_04210 [Actinobacteria bacterium]|nr:hypothetical protein [Actinomycetota bacterium]
MPSINEVAVVPTSTTLGITNYYVSQTTGTGCESGRSLIVVTVNPNPIAPVVNNLTYCQNEVAPSLVALAASGNTLNWYGTNATGGMGIKGRDLLRKMMDLNIILDATHLCDDSFWEAMEYHQGPVWASHQNCRALVDHNRQLPKHF